MNKDFLKTLVCPINKSKLKIITKKDIIKNSSFDLSEIMWDWNEINYFLITTKKPFNLYPVVNGVPRLVSGSGYSKNFGFQWNKFSNTQLDSSSGLSISKKRFYDSTGWEDEKLHDKIVLDIGCGSGRFTEIALKSGAKVIAIDYSEAVDACNKNLGSHPNLLVLQADIYALPFDKNAFDYVFCLGVIQHTPNIYKSLCKIVEVLKKRGKLCVDFYERSWKSYFWIKYWIRPFTKHIPNKLLFQILKKTVPSMLKLSRIIQKIPLIGNYLKWLIPVVNYTETYPLSRKQLNQWSLLDTFDMLSPTYDCPSSFDEVKEWANKLNLSEVKIFRPWHLVLRGTKLRNHIYD